MKLKMRRFGWGGILYLTLIFMINLADGKNRTACPPVVNASPEQIVDEEDFVIDQYPQYKMKIDLMIVCQSKNTHLETEYGKITKPLIISLLNARLFEEGNFSH